jgi:hypothetical protein
MDSEGIAQRKKRNDQSDMIAFQLLGLGELSPKTSASATLLPDTLFL